MDLARTIAAHATARPDRVAITFGHETLTYGSFWKSIREEIGILKDGLGVAEGDRVAFLGYNSPTLLILLFACARLGATLVPLNWRLSPRELAGVINDAAPSVIYAAGSFTDTIDEIRAELDVAKFVGLPGQKDGWFCHAALQADSRSGEAPELNRGETPLLIIYTSGTTGQPKGGVHTQNAVFWTALNSVFAHDFSAGDHVLTDLPLFHIGGLLLQTVPILFAGGRVTLHERFDPGNALRDIALLRPTTYLAVPATMRALIDDPGWRDADLSPLRQVMAGSAIVPLDLIDGFHGRGIPVGQLYGATEMGIGTCLRADEAFRQVGSCGKPAAYCDLRVVGDDGSDLGPLDTGEVLVRGPALMTGYWRNPEATAEVLADGWYRTGDVGLRDERGYLWLKARKSEVINAGGEKIYPAEIESVLAECEAIAEAAVVGYADPKWGELPAAFIIRRNGVAFEAKDVVGFLDGRLARYKHPRRLLFVDEFPRNAMGKVSKRALSERAAAAAGGTDGEAGIAE